jgi:flagellar biosynthesis anti-sigma factor FlgM
MKIENVGNGVTPLSSKPTEPNKRIEKKEDARDVHGVRNTQDKAQMSDNARLLMKARGVLGTVEDPNNDRLEMLKEQIASGNYSIQLNDLARKIIARFYPK